MALTKKQRRFIDEYFIDFNATQAAIRAGYSERTAHSIGWENLRKPDISDAIEHRLKESAMLADEVLMRLAEQARASFEDFIDEDGNVDLSKARRAGKLHLINSVTDPSKFRGREISLHNQQRALELIGKAYGLFTDRVIQEQAKIEIEYTNDWRGDETQ